MKLTPAYDYLYCEELKPEVGAITGTDVTEHWQRFKVLAAGLGRYEYGIFIENHFQAGQVIWVQKHAEADTPPELAQEGKALIQATRVMAVEE